MEFRLESEMAEPVRRWLDSEGYCVTFEYRMPWGLCDILGVSFQEDHVRARVQHEQRFAIGSLLRADMLLHIPDVENHRGRTLVSLQKRYETVVDPETVAQELRTLVARRFVRTSHRRSYKKINGWLPLHKRIVAIELKLSRVDEALHQAILNQTIADLSYIGLPASIAQRVCTSRKALEFKDKGVGIIEVTTDTCKIVLDAVSRKSQQNSALQLLCADRMFQTRIKGTSA